MEFALSEFEPVADRVWCATAEPASVTVGLVAGDAGCLVVDTGSSPAQGRQIREAAQRTAGVPVLAAVVTHAHYDHLYGLAAFSDVATYGHTSVAALLEREAKASHLEELGVEADELVAPNRTFKLATVVDLGGRHVELVHFGAGHTPADVVALVPDAGVVFAGDLIEESGPPSFETESSLSGWPRALDGFLGTLRSDSIVVPGHGMPVSREFAFRQRGELAGTYLQLEYLFMQGARPDNVYERGEWFYARPMIEAAAASVYEELKARGRIGRPLRVLH